MKNLIPILILLSCNKDIERNDCKQCVLISDKYSNSVLIKSDTLYNDNICGVELQKVRDVKQSWYQVNCDNPNITEHWFYIIK